MTPTATLTAIKKFYKTVTGAIAVITGAPTVFNVKKLAVGGMTPTGAFSRVASLYRTVTGAPPALTGGITLKNIKLTWLAGSLSVLTGAVTASKVLHKVVVGVLTMTGAFSRVASLFRSVAGAPPALTGAAVKKVAVSYAGAPAALVGAALRKVGSVRAGGLTLAGTQTRGIKRLLAGGLTLAGAAVKKVAVAYAGALTLAGTTLGVPNYGGSSVEYKTITGALTMSGGRAAKVGKALSGVGTFAGAVVTALFRLDWTAGDAPLIRQGTAKKNIRGSESGGDE
jgi:hypothetical protein